MEWVFINTKLQRLNFHSLMKKKITIIDRIKLPTPFFWRKVRRLGITLVSFGGAVALIKSQYGILWIPTMVYEHSIVAGTVMGFLSQLAIDPIDHSNNKTT